MIHRQNVQQFAIFLPLNCNKKQARRDSKPTSNTPGLLFQMKCVSLLSDNRTQYAMLIPNEPAATSQQQRKPLRILLHMPNSTHAHTVSHTPRPPTAFSAHILLCTFPPRQKCYCVPKLCHVGSPKVVSRIHTELDSRFRPLLPARQPCCPLSPYPSYHTC